MFSLGLSALIAANEPNKVVAQNCSLPDSIPAVKRMVDESNFPSMLASGIQPNATELIVTLGSNEGAPLSVSVSTSSGFTALDEAAVKAARNAVFAPETRGCTPVAGSYFLTIQY
jgi:TonB family protein